MLNWVEDKRYPNDPDNESFCANVAGIGAHLLKIRDRWVLSCPFLHVSGMQIDAQTHEEALAEAEYALTLVAATQERKLRDFISRFGAKGSENSVENEA